MSWISVGTKIASFILQYPFEHHIKPNYSKSEKLRQELMEASSSITVISSPPPISPKVELELDEIIRREQEGDYCVSCVPAKHLMRAKDALGDALNIANTKGEFTQVAEDKLQQAVYELNASEKDLELARIPSVIKPASDELHTQIRKLRNFLRQDQSGLEIATAIPKENFEEMKDSLETAHQVSDALIHYGYDIAKVQLRARAEEAKKEAQSG